MYALIDVLNLAIGLYIWVIIASAIMSWLMAFGVINTSNPFVRSVGEFLFRLTEPALAPLRRIIPPLGGIDITPIILYFILIFIQGLLTRDLPRMMGMY